MYAPIPRKERISGIDISEKGFYGIYIDTRNILSLSGIGMVLVGIPILLQNLFFLIRIYYGIGVDSVGIPISLQNLLVIIWTNHGIGLASVGIPALLQNLLVIIWTNCGLGIF